MEKKYWFYSGIELNYKGEVYSHFCGVSYQDHPFKFCNRYWMQRQPYEVINFYKEITEQEFNIFVEEHTFTRVCIINEGIKLEAEVAIGSDIFSGEY